MPTLNFLLVFYLITSFGSALSAIASFFNIEPYFSSLFYLGIALSVRTLASCIFSYAAPKIINRLGLFYSFAASQVFGCLSLGVLFLGFYNKNFIITLAGLMLTALPMTFVVILLSITFKTLIAEEKLFRKYSGSRELIANIAILFAALLSPILLIKFNINYIILIDLISYIFGLLLLKTIKIQKNSLSEAIPKHPLLMRQLLTKPDVTNFILRTSVSLLLAGMAPLLASSDTISLTAHIPLLQRQWLWLIEQLTGIIASIFYVNLFQYMKNKFLTYVLILNSFWLIMPLLYNNNYIILVTIVITSFLIQLSFLRFRDDLILAAGDNTQLISTYSAITLGQKSFIYSLSPLILVLLFNLSEKRSIIGIILLQVFLFLIAFRVVKGYLTRNQRYN